MVPSESIVQVGAQAGGVPAGCSRFHAAVELIGRRWNGVILQALLVGCGRFSTVRAAIPGITDAMLTQRLRELEDAGIVTREVIDGRPVEIRYALTEIGAQLAPILNAISDWGDRWARATGQAGATDGSGAPDR